MNYFVTHHIILTLTSNIPYYPPYFYPYSYSYPKLKAFEKVCDASQIPFPVDHITAGKTELSPQAVASTFGPDFVAKHHL